MKFLITILIALIPATSNAQNFVKTFKVLQDSVAIKIESSSHPGILPPLNQTCLELRVPNTGHQGKVLVELDSVQLAAFYGYMNNGTISACFVMEDLVIKDGKIIYQDKVIPSLTIRIPKDLSFR